MAHKPMHRKPKRAIRVKPKPDPIAEPQAEPASAPQSEPEKPGLLANLKNSIGNLLGNSQPETAPAESVAGSEKPLTTSEPAFSSEVERALAAVPDTAEPQPEETASEGDLSELVEVSGADRIDALIALGYVDVPTVAESADSAFDFLADHFQSDHWKLSAKARDRLARPACAVTNSVIDKVMSMLPDAVGNSALAHPEFVLLALVLVSICGPRWVKQMKLNRAKKILVPNQANPHSGFASVKEEK